MGVPVVVLEIPEKHRKVKRRRQVLGATLWVLIAAVTVWIFWHEGQPPEFVKWTTVTVQPGQSMWNIAVRVDPYNNTNLVVDAIEQKNGMKHSTLRTGQTLLVPVGVTK